MKEPLTHAELCERARELAADLADRAAERGCPVVFVAVALPRMPPSGTADAPNVGSLAQPYAVQWRGSFLEIAGLARQATRILDRAIDTSERGAAVDLRVVFSGTGGSGAGGHATMNERGDLRYTGGGGGAGGTTSVVAGTKGGGQ
jgi:hypothetical protein